MTNLIPLSYLNEVCYLSLNEDDKKYQASLKIAQETFLRKELGRSFYTELVTQYAAQTFTADNDAFYEDSGLKDYLAWQTCFNYLKFANFNFTPTGLREFIDDNSTIISDVKTFSVEKNIQQILNLYKGEMLTYLKEAQLNDSTKYPLYDQKCTNEFSFGITSINAQSDAMFKVNKTIIRNE
jgi:hypothetical protein